MFRSFGGAQTSGLLAVLVMLLVLAACESDPMVEPEPTRETDLSADEFDSAAFADEFPMHFESYVANMERGGERESKLVVGVEPDLPMLWANYPFADSYNFPRPHTFGVDDVTSTPRIGDASIGSCMTCKSSTVPTLIDEFGEDYWSANFRDEIQPRVEELAAEGGHEDLGELGHVSIGCSDCHNPENMEPRVNRPSFLAAMERRGIDHLAEASRNDMRADVCGQCHVNYYFYPETQKVTFPWDEGLRAEDQLEYMQVNAREAGFERDWVHGVSGADMLKTQHPEYELWSYGAHGEAGVTCADCHMPYQRVDGQKMTDHDLASPLETVDRSCRSCHADRSAGELRDRVHDIQERHLEAKYEAQELSVDAHYHINRMITAGADEERIAEAQELVREGQFLWDFIAAENSDGFHNSQGAMDALRTSSNLSNQAINIATAELQRLDVDLDELREEIDNVKDDVYSEDDPSLKHDLVNNEFFPYQGD